MKIFTKQKGHNTGTHTTVQNVVWRNFKENSESRISYLLQTWCAISTIWRWKQKLDKRPFLFVQGNCQRLQISAKSIGIPYSKRSWERLLFMYREISLSNIPLTEKQTYQQCSSYTLYVIIKEERMGITMKPTCYNQQIKSFDMK